MEFSSFNRLWAPDLLYNHSRFTVQVTKSARVASNTSRKPFDTCRRNDQAVGVIMTKIEPSEYSGLEKKSQLRKFGMP